MKSIKNENIYKYKFSIVIPIYNVEKYLEETIESVVNQTIGFEKNVQIILVNDGSPDNSEEICLKYKERYPSNVVYIKQENAGVSAARNNGKNYIEGKYVCFLDSDDKWEKHAFKRVWDFFEENQDEIDVVACRIKFFDGKNEYHPLDFKFDKDKIVDIKDDYNYIQLMGITVFSKANVIIKYDFDSKLKYGEDAFWVNRLILEKGKYGIKSDAIYYYRKRVSASSAQDKALVSKEYYLDVLKLYLNGLYNYTKKYCKDYLKYIESVLIYEIYWRIKSEIPKEVLTDKEKKEYINGITKLIISFDDDVIINSLAFDIHYKIYFLKVKYKEEFQKKVKIDKKGLFFNGTLISKKFSNIYFTKFRVENESLVVYGKFTPIFNEDNCVLFSKEFDSNKKNMAELFKLKNWIKYSFDGNIIYKPYMYKFEIPINKKTKIINYYTNYNASEIQLDFRISKKYSLSPKYKQYRIIDRKCIVSRNNNQLIVSKFSIFNLIKSEFTCFFDLLKKKKFKTIIKRLMYIFIYIKNKLKMLKPLKNIIVLESNPDFTDNTKAIFDLLIKNRVNEKYKIVWFVKDKKNFDDIKINNVEFLEFFGINKNNLPNKVKYYYENAKIILDANKYIQKNSPKQIRIHLNHGSPFKNAKQYNMSIGDVDYIIVQSNFFKPVEADVRDVEKSKIIPLGFPRNDVLYSKEKYKFDLIDNLNTSKKILWLPTYRNHQISNNNELKFKYGLSCVNNEKELIALNNKLKERNITLIIKFHPVEKTDLIEKYNLSNILVINDNMLKESKINLYQLFTKVDALITDYSSVYFDFCLTKKNIGLAISDIDDYIKENGEFQYKYKDAIIGNYMYNNKDLLKFVDDVALNRDKTYKERLKLIKKYDDYRDGKATERVYEFIKKFL